MHFCKVLFLYGFLLPLTTPSPTPPAASPLPLKSSALACPNSTLLTRCNKLSYSARDQAAKTFPSDSGYPTLPLLHRSLVPPLTCRGPQKILCEEICRCNHMQVMYCGVFTDAEVTAFWSSTQNSATAMAKVTNQAMATCQPSCRCHSDARPKVGKRENDGRGRWKRRPTRSTVRRSEQEPCHPPSSYSRGENAPSSAVRSHALQPGTDAGQSAPSLYLPSSYPFWADKDLGTTQCKGVNRTDCQKHCYCTLYGTVDCSMTSTITLNALTKSMGNFKAKDLVNQQAKHVTEHCRPVCRCGGGPSGSSRPADKSEEREREAMENQKKTLTEDLQRRSENRIVNLVAPPSSTFTSNVHQWSSFPNLPLPFPPLQARSDAQPGGSKENPLPASAWLPPPRFAGPEPPKAIICKGKDEPFCKDRCGCNSDGTLLCNKKLQAGLQSLVGIATRETALGLAMQQIPGVMAKCGLICRCGKGISNIKFGTIGVGEGLGTTPSVGAVGAGRTFRTKVARREGMPHGRLITKRTDNASPSTPAPLTSSLRVHSSPAVSPIQPQTESSSAMQMPAVVSSKSLYKGLEPNSRLRCTGDDPHGMDARFCLERCECTPEGRVNCEEMSQKKKAEIIKKKPWPQNTVQYMMRKVDTVIAGECKAICTCEHTMGRPPKPDSTRKTAERPLPSARSSSKHRDTSSMAFPILQSRSGLSPSTRESSNLPVRVASPPSVKPKEYPEHRRFIECHSSKINLLDECEARCYCTFSGFIKCDKLNAQAIDAVTGSVTKDGVMTQEWATLLVTQHSQRTLYKCEPICACHDKPDLGAYRTVKKPGMESPGSGSAGSGESSSPRGVVNENRDLSHSALAQLRPRSGAGLSTPRKENPPKAPALDIRSPVERDLDS